VNQAWAGHPGMKVWEGRGGALGYPAARESPRPSGLGPPGDCLRGPKEHPPRRIHPQHVSWGGVTFHSWGPDSRGQASARRPTRRSSRRAGLSNRLRRRRGTGRHPWSLAASPETCWNTPKPRNNPANVVRTSRPKPTHQPETKTGLSACLSDCRSRKAATEPVQKFGARRHVRAGCDPKPKIHRVDP
jgi:hypothetical protein